MSKRRTVTHTTAAASAVVLTVFLALVGTTASAAPRPSVRAPDGATQAAARSWVDWEGTKRATIRHKLTSWRMLPADWVTWADYPVRIWSGDTGGAHEWDITQKGTQTINGIDADTYEIRNVKSNRCLQPSPYINDVRIWQVTCGDSVEQRWILPDAKYGGEDEVQIVPAWRSHQALVPPNTVGSWSDLVLQDKSSALEQVWRIEH